jgi:acyl-CoA synthetase (AMP-forming)/AMP-acid ligase II
MAHGYRLGVARELLIGDIFRNAGRAVPNRVAAALGDATLTFGEIDRRSNATLRALMTVGVGRHDRVAVWSATDLDTVPVFAALAKLGAVFAPVSAQLSVDEATPTVGAIRPMLLLVDNGRAKSGDEVAEALQISSISNDELAALADEQDDADLAVQGLSEHDPHVVFFTSGSTGRAKGAVISHRVNFLRTHPGALLEPRGAMVCMYPLFHMGAWTIALQQWQARDCVVFVESADAVPICDAVERHRATRLNCIPAVWRRILDHLASPEGKNRDLSSIRFADSGTSATPVELLTAIEAALPNARIRVFYGSTESGSVAALEHADMRRKPGSCGPPAPWTAVRLTLDGELCVRGPLLFDGYFDNPEATAAALVDGWYHTGDLADIDTDGYLTIVGRARDVIRTGGETVAPAEVEAALSTHRSIADVAVVGMPDPDWGEVVTAAVVIIPGADPLALADVRHHCEGRLAPFKYPRRLVIVDAIPRTASTNQVQRRLLVEQLG